MSWWHVGAVANLALLVTYLAIAYGILRSLIPQQRWRSNPLAVATVAVFFTGAVHHGFQPVSQLLPALLWDVVTAAVGIWYLMLRTRLPTLVRSSALFEDGITRERQALEIHDNVVQGLATAKLAFELEDRDRGMKALDDALTAARTIITDLLQGEQRVPSGALRRSGAAGSDTT